MCVGYFLVLLDVTIVDVALPSIASGLGADVAAVQWWQRVRSRGSAPRSCCPERSRSSPMPSGGR
jgi:hypothetical protein